MNEHRGDLNLITVFLEVFRQRSITRAAEALDLTQPAVSAALKRFREQVGTDLFVRDGRGIAPTTTAEFLAAELAPLMNSVDNTLANLGEFDPNVPRTFRITVIEPLIYHFQHWLEDNRDRLGRCRVHLELAPNSMEDLMRALSVQRVDLAIDVSNDDNPSYLCEPLKEDRIVVVCDEDHPRLGDAVSADAFFDEEHVAIRYRRGGKAALEYFARASRQRNIVLECESFLSVLALVSGSELVGSVPGSLAEMYADRFGLKVLDLPFPVEPVRQFLVYHRRLADSPAHRWLRETLTTAAGEF